MTAYHERSFGQRFGAMGDKAEGAFLEAFPTAHRSGLNRPSFSMAGMPACLRYIPDFTLRDGFYEVMGFSSRGNDSLKLKFEKADALMRWTVIGPVNLWLYDSARRESYCAPIERWIEACHRHATREYFADNDRPYWNLSREYFPVEAIPC